MLIHTALAQSWTWQQICAQAPHPTYVVDEVTADHLPLAVGEDTEDIVRRWATLRIATASAGVQRQHMDSRGDFFWGEDHGP